MKPPRDNTLEQGENSTPASRVTWFPGHMRKAQNRLAEEVKACNVVVELRDARLPVSSANPELEKIIGGRQRLVVFNKTSLADPACSSLWQAHFESRGLACLFMDAGNSRDNGLLVKRLEQMSKPYMEGFRRRGIRPPSPRVMVVGIPNVGKSTLINRLAGKKKQTTGPVPGTTRSLNWVLVKERFHLLDSPGVMLPRIQTDEDAFRFGWIGTLPDHLVGRERVAASLLDHFLPALPAGLFAHYQLSLPPVGMSGQAVLEWLAGQKQVLKKKGVPDTARMAEILMTDFRKGILGRYTLEMPGL